VALAFGWFVMVGACLAGVLRHATAEGEDYLLKGINHPVVYAVAFVLIGIIPAYSHYFCATHLLWGVVNINDNSMYPTLVPGDTLLIDRLAFERKTPVRGAKVVVRTGVDEMNHVTLSRVLALPGDSVRLKDGKVLVNDEVLERFYYGEDGKLPEDAFAGEDVPGSKWVYVEKNDGHRYVVAGELQPRLEEDEQEVIVVSEGNLLLLPDNRSDTGKDPFVQVASANVLGRPRYILYSRSIQDEGRDPRWARIGLRID
jgi:signal peptidase I